MKAENIKGRAEPKCPYLSATFIDLFNCYANEKFKGSDTKIEYLENISFLCNFAKTDFLQLTFPLIQSYFSSLSSSVKLGTRKNRMRMYLAVARYVDENARIASSLASAFQLVALEQEELDMEYKLDDLPDLQNVDRVLSYFNDTGDMVMFISVALALFCCQPTSVIINLKKEMFFQDLTGNYGIRIPISSLNDRFVKIPEDLALIIAQYTRARSGTSPYLLLNSFSKPIKAHTLQLRLSNACKECGVPTFTMNKLRVLGTTLMIKGGAPLDKVAEHINVKKKDWFFRYGRIVKELNDSAVDYIHLKIVR